MPLMPSHWEAVMTIYESGLATGNATFQVTAPATWEQWDKEHLAHSRFVAKADNDVVGWVALSPTSARNCYKGVCELSIYIDNDYRNKGIGSMLLKAIVESSEAAGVWCLYSSTFPENKASIALQKKFGSSGLNREKTPTIKEPQAPADNRTLALITLCLKAIIVLRSIGYPTQNKTKAATAKLK